MVCVQEWIHSSANRENPLTLRTGMPVFTKARLKAHERFQLKLNANPVYPFTEQADGSTFFDHSHANKTVLTRDRTGFPNSFQALLFSSSRRACQYFILYYSHSCWVVLRAFLYLLYLGLSLSLIFGVFV